MWAEIAFLFYLKMLTLYVSFERNLQVSLTALQNECLAPGELLPLLREPDVPPTLSHYDCQFWIACPWQTGAEEWHLSVPTFLCTVEHSQLSERP